MSCGEGRGRGSDPALLWLWCRLAAAATIQPLARKFPYAAGAALKQTNQQETQLGLSFAERTQVGEPSPQTGSAPFRGVRTSALGGSGISAGSWHTRLAVVSGRKTQTILEEKLKKLEEECKQKEAERVSLELELTEVKESLKKALAGGVTLGLAIEPRAGTSSPQVTSPRPRKEAGVPSSGGCSLSPASPPRAAARGPQTCFRVSCLVP